MMDRQLNDMTEAQLAEWQYAHREELDAEEGEVVDVDVAPQVSVTMSFRLPGTEADSIRAAAQEAGMTLSGWIRQACDDAIRPSEAATNRREVEAALNEFTENLDLMRKRLETAVGAKSRTAGKKTKRKTAAKRSKTATKKASKTGKTATTGTAIRSKRSS